MKIDEGKVSLSFAGISRLTIQVRLSVDVAHLADA